MDAVHDKMVDRLTRLEIAIDNHSDKISESSAEINHQLFVLNERLERLTDSIEDLFRVYNDWNKDNKRK